jgi:predicted DNA-binding WGR domain protein
MSIMAEMKVMDYRSLRYTDEKSDKFWSIALSGCSHTVNYGRYSTDGQTQTKDLPTEDAARKSYDKLVAEKLKKGYVEDVNVPPFILMKACEKIVADKLRQGAEDGTIELPQRDLTDDSPESLVAYSSAMSELYARLLSEEMKKELDNRAATSVATISTSVTTSTSKEVISVSAKQAKSNIKEDRFAKGEATPTIEIPVVIEPKTIELNTERSIDLNPEDWYWATWRNLPPLHRSEPKPFDLQDCLKRLRKVAEGLDWAKAKIATFLSCEETHFWIAAIAESRGEDGALLDPNEIAKILSSRCFDGNSSIEELKKFTENINWYNLHFVESLSFVNLFEIEQSIEILRMWFYQKSPACIFQDRLLPYLSTSQLERWQSYIRQQLDINNWPVQNNYSEPPAEFFLAAYLGIHDELLKLVESWSDDNFSHPDRIYLAHYQRPQEIIFGLKDRELVERHIRRLDLKLQPTQNGSDVSKYIRAWLAHTEYSALDVIRDTVLAAGKKEEAVDLLKAFALVKAPEAAPFMLELMLSSKAPQIARQWLEDNPAHAIAGIIPIVAGRGKLADAAIEFLQSMKRKGYTDFIQTCIENESSEIAEKIRSSVLNIEEKEYIQFDEITTPVWLQQAIDLLVIPNKKTTWKIGSIDLPPIVCCDYCLNDRQIESVLNALRQSELIKPHALVTAIKIHANSAELDTFTWKLFERWMGEGAPSKENWAMVAIGLLGSDISALKLAPLVKIWPGESQHARAVLGLSCLRSIGSDTALMQINSIAQKVKFKGIKQRAQECMESIATERNMSRAELEDRIVPDCDLDERGTRMFDFGARQFRFVLGADLKPMVKDNDNKVKSDLPKPNAKDDREKAELAIAEWKLLKKQVSEVIKLQPARLEQAMITGRRWRVDEFEMLLVQHPLITHLAQRIVWSGYDAAGKSIATFRNTEDRTYADPQDETFQLTGIDRIGIIHPLNLSAELRAVWGELMSDYEIIPPFPQLGRPLYGLNPGEETALEITRFKDLEIPIVALVRTLENLGWEKGVLHDHGDYSLHFKYFPAADITAVVGDYEAVFVDLGTYVGEVDRIDGCCFLPGLQNYLDDYPIGSYRQELKDRCIPLGAVDPIVISEVLKDLTTVAAKAK